MSCCVSLLSQQLSCCFLWLSDQTSHGCKGQCEGVSSLTFRSVPWRSRFLCLVTDQIAGNHPCSCLGSNSSTSSLDLVRHHMDVKVNLHWIWPGFTWMSKPMRRCVACFHYIVPFRRLDILPSTGASVSYGHIALHLSLQCHSIYIRFKANVISLYQMLQVFVIWNRSRR